MNRLAKRPDCHSPNINYFNRYIEFCVHGLRLLFQGEGTLTPHLPPAIAMILANTTFG